MVKLILRSLIFVRMKPDVNDTFHFTDCIDAQLGFPTATLLDVMTLLVLGEGSDVHILEVIDYFRVVCLRIDTLTSFAIESPSVEWAPVKKFVVSNTRCNGQT